MANYGTPHNFVDLSGQMFGDWDVISRTSEKGKAVYVCFCKCGTVKMVLAASLRTGKSLRCRRCSTAQRNITHGMSNTAEFKTWAQMIQRCENPNASHYGAYGERGIKVCDRWRNSFENFLEDMGAKPTPKHSIERKNVNGNYEPSNCKWATRHEQMRNTRATKMIILNGKEMCLTDWFSELGVKRATYYQRIRKGFTPEEALTSEVKRYSY